jgi:hypothetical protein
MTAYVDDMNIMYRGKPRFHMSADSIAELHAFALLIGVKRCWWHSGSRYPHYDINLTQRATAVAAGAQEVTAKQLVVMLKRLYPVKGITAPGPTI